tara:strand:+ start:25197 stop:25829 length:633 start_codon:yes stop_codon:yes gene_type:complete
MINIILGLCAYNIFEDYMKRDSKTDIKLIENHINFFHVFSSSILLFQSYIMNYPNFFNFLITTNTLGYFMNDTLRYIKKRKWKKNDYIFMYHHLSSVIYIYSVYQTDTSYWKEVLFFAELSNIPTVINYNYIQHNRLSPGKYENQLKELLPIHLYWYGSFRVIGLSYITFKELMNNTLNIYLLMTLPLLFIGYVWTYSLYNKHTSQIKIN